jgi:hypothetical protein
MEHGLVLSLSDCIFFDSIVLGCQPTFVQGTVDPHHCYTIFNTAKNQTDATYYCSKYFITPFKLGLKKINNALENSELLS